MGIAYNPRIVRDGLVLHLDAANPKSYPGTGTTWKDLSGLGNNGTLVNGISYSSDDKGSLVFDGVNDYVPIGASGFPFGSSAGTLVGWAKTNTIASGFKWVISYGNPANGQSRFIGINGTRYYFGGYGNDISAVGVISNTWVNIVGVYDGTNASIYINGILAAGPSLKSWNTVVNNAQIGKQTNTASEHWNGDISQTSVYNRALSAAEIRQNFEVTRGRYGI